MSRLLLRLTGSSTRRYPIHHSQRQPAAAAAATLWTAQVGAALQMCRSAAGCAAENGASGVRRQFVERSYRRAITTAKHGCVCKASFTATELTHLLQTRAHRLARHHHDLLCSLHRMATDIALSQLGRLVLDTCVPVGLFTLEFAKNGSLCDVNVPAGSFARVENSSSVQFSHVM